MINLIKNVFNAAIAKHPNKCQIESLKQFYAETASQIRKIENCLNGIEWDDMTTAEKQIYVIIHDGNLPENR
jgi:hypothetical protein